MTNNQTYHTAVLLAESIEALKVKENGIYVDVTFGGGSHSRAIFDRLNESGRLVVFDQDRDARKNAWDAPNFDFVAANFTYLSNHLRLMKIHQVDGVLADLGVSSHQFDQASRGFSIRTEATLDMRMNQNAQLSAKSVVNDHTEEQLLRIFRSYGEIHNASKLVQEIAAFRSSRLIKSTKDLLEIAEKCAPKHKEHKYFAQVFQAIRIEVNNEMVALEDFLTQCVNVIKPGGRLAIISYHSLEDRMVKNFMKRGSITGHIEKDFYGNVLKSFTEIVRHPIVPGENELKENSRARSAKLRIAERNG
jgi:16S rRNA (cytosine1402-N4)-methyltransferase